MKSTFQTNYKDKVDTTSKYHVKRYECSPQEYQHQPKANQWLKTSRLSHPNTNENRL